MSGIGSCDAAKTYSTPDTATASLGGTCRDLAGNQSAAATLRVQVRRDEPVGDGGAVPAAERQRLVPGAAHGRLHRRRRNVGRQLVRGREELRRPGRRRRLCRRHLPRPGRQHRELRPSPSSTTRLPLRRARRPLARRMRTAGSTLRSPSASRGRTPCQGSSPVPPPRTTPGPTPRRARSTEPAWTRPATPRTASLALKYDATPPQTTAAASRQPNAPAGTGRRSRQLRRHGRDLDGRLCEAAKSYSGPDSGAAVGQRHLPRQGRKHGRGRLTLKYDATAPVASATPSRQPNAPAGTGLRSRQLRRHRRDLRARLLPAPKNYGGPDNAAAVGRRHLPRQGRKRGDGLAPAQVRRDGTAGDRDGVPPAERRRLVQRTP